MFRGNYGHFVAKRALEMANPEQSEALIEVGRKNLRAAVRLCRRVLCLEVTYSFLSSSSTKGR